MKNKKSKKGLWFTVLTLMIIGSLATGVLQNSEIPKEKYMHRILRGLREEYNTIELQDLSCSEFNCIGVDGVYISIPELGNNSKVWVYKYNDKKWVDYSKQQYDQINSIPLMPKTSYYANGHFFIHATHEIEQEEFNKIIDLIIEEL